MRVHAATAALRQIEHDAEDRGRPPSQPLVREAPRVAEVRQGGPAYGKLVVGDIVLTIDEVEVQTTTALIENIRARTVGTKVEFLVEHADGRREEVVISQLIGTGDPQVATTGVTWEQSYDFRPIVVQLDLDPAVADAEAGLAVALALYDLMGEGDLLEGRAVAAAGVLQLVEPDGPLVATVEAVGAIREKIAAAEDAGAAAFLLPEANCLDLEGFDTDVDLVPVADFQGAVQALADLADEGSAAEVRRC
jgi:PDZ domain-containing protein